MFYFSCITNPLFLIIVRITIFPAVQFPKTPPNLTISQPMRIRKNAWKLLGTPFYHPSSSSNFVRSEVQESTAIVCEVSSNPWDLPEFEDYNCYRNVANLKDQEDEDGDILGKAIINHNVVEPISTWCPEEEALPSMTKSELTSTTEAATVKKKRGRKKKNNNEGISLENERRNTKYCKKTDGKGWYCRREVENPHDLCSYHEEQLRTYTTTSHSTMKSTRNASGKIDGNSSLYYYYDGLGPCSGKRRGTVESGVVNEKGYDGGGDDDGASNLIIAGDDEYDNDVLEYEDGKEFCGEKDVKKEKENLEEEEKKKVRKKRGRKPVKARSLKSIL